MSGPEPRPTRPFLGEAGMWLQEVVIQWVDFNPPANEPFARFLLEPTRFAVRDGVVYLQRQPLNRYKQRRGYVPDGEIWYPVENRFDPDWQYNDGYRNGVEIYGLFLYLSPVYSSDRPDINHPFYPLPSMAVIHGR